MQTCDFNHTLGAGIYSIPDVAFILRLPAGKVRRWMNEFWDTRLAESNTKYSWGEGRNKATNFYTLMEFYVFYQLRELNVSTNRILTAHEDIANQLKTRYPFASHKVLTDGKSILFTLEDGTIVKADKTKQAAFKEIINSFCKKIEFSEADIAEKFYPMGKDKKIIIDPHHQFGQPVIENTNILAETIFNLYQAGDSPALISRIYKLSKKEIEDAITLFTSKKVA